MLNVIYYVKCETDWNKKDNTITEIEIEANDEDIQWYEVGDVTDEQLGSDTQPDIIECTMQMRHSTQLANKGICIKYISMYTYAEERYL